MAFCFCCSRLSTATLARLSLGLPPLRLVSDTWHAHRGSEAVGVSRADQLGCDPCDTWHVHEGGS